MPAPLLSWLRGLGLWILVVLFFTVQGWVGRAASGEPIPFLRQVRGEVFTFLPWTLFWPGIFAVARRFPVERRRPRNVLVLVAFGSIVAVAHVVVGISLSDLFRFEPLPMATTARILATLPRAFGVNVVFYAALVAIAQADAWRRASEARAIREAQLEATLARAELGLLRMQLHPHFLFNTLHAISALMTRDTQGARRMIAGLSELLRLSLEGDGDEQIPLAREIDHLRHYIGIQQTRFSDRLTVELCVDPEAPRARVPKLLLQPLVENAIRHGLEPRTTPGHIRVEARREGERLKLIIEDDGAGLPADRPPREGVGLGNTRARLDKLYGDDHRFTLDDRPEGGAVVTIDLPFMLESPERRTPNDADPHVTRR